MSGLLEPTRIRQLLGRRDWHPGRAWDTRDGYDGTEQWLFDRRDETRRLLVTLSPLDEDDDTLWLHASISTGLLFDREPDAMPTYADLALMHRAVFGNRYAYQVFAPPADHVNIRDDVLHLWGRWDGEPADMAFVADKVRAWRTI